MEICFSWAVAMSMPSMLSPLFGAEILYYYGYCMNVLGGCPPGGCALA